MSESKPTDRVRARPVPTSDAIRERFERQRRRDTRPELALRRDLHRRGIRYRVDRSPLPGMRSRADVVFGPSKVAVFVDGCFWHSCPAHATVPKNNRDWWVEKLTANVARDRRVDGLLAEAGWLVIRVWEHEDMSEAASGVEALVRPRRPPAPGASRRAQSGTEEERPSTESPAT